MSLTVRDLYRLEIKAREHAERLRHGSPEADLLNPSVSFEAKAHIRNERARADDFDQIGNLLAGLQGDWDALGPLVRDGYMRMQAAYEALKERGRDAEDAA